MGSNVKAGTISNVRKSRYASVIYWTFFYTYTFLIATRYFLYEDGFVTTSFSYATLYEHVALMLSTVVGFAVLRHRNLSIPKKILNIVSPLLLMFGAIFVEVRTSPYYLVCLAIVLGQLATCSLLTYIYEMNNAERLFGIVFCHLLVAATSFLNIFFTRETAVFWWVITAMAVVSTVACFFEKTGADNVYIQEPFQKKLYVPLVLACIGGFCSVCSSIMMISRCTLTVDNVRYFFYGGAIIGAIAYYLIYRFSKQPATVSLIIGFVCSALSIVAYLSNLWQISAYASAVLAGATFNICMMNLYYILCNIIKKYRDSNMLKTAPIVSNIVGAGIAVMSAMMLFFASDLVYNVVLCICLIGDLIILATSIVWQNGLSGTSKQEEYVRFDTTITRAQAYETVGLTDKECEVADMLLEGLSLKEISTRLFISENTAKTHRSSIYKKMQVSSKEELADRLKDTLS